MHRLLRARWATIAVPSLAMMVAAGSAGTLGSRGAKPKPAVTPCSPQVDITTVTFHDPEVIAINREIDSTFAAVVAQVNSAPPTSQYAQKLLLGKVLLFDKNLSVNKNVACVTCHMPETGYTGSAEIFNRTIVAYPGSSENLTSARKPQSYTYAPFSGILQYDKTAKVFRGGNFWDMRATGITIDNPAAEQAQGPPLNPVEMANPDAACVVYRIATGPYRAYFEKIWGPQSFAINWPANVVQVCSIPAPAPANNPLPVQLSAVDRGTVMTTYNSMGLSMATYEAAPDISSFSSKFDSALANPTQQILTANEQAGWALYRGKGKCNTCHVDGTSSARASAGPNAVTPATIADQFPLFSDFTSSNLGLPKNVAMRFYCETTPNSRGYAPNPAGLGFTDLGVGAFLRGTGNPNPAWTPLASSFDGTMQVPTVRNVDMRPRPDFLKDYMHNGYLKSLNEVVHFYNTRDVLPRCGPDNAGEKVTCWPAPEVAANVDSTIGKLGLTPHEEDLIVEFLRTLTDKAVNPLTITNASQSRSSPRPSRQ